MAGGQADERAYLGARLGVRLQVSGCYAPGKAQKAQIATYFAHWGPVHAYKPFRVGSPAPQSVFGGVCLETLGEWRLGASIWRLDSGVAPNFFLVLVRVTELASLTSHLSLPQRLDRVRMCQDKKYTC